LPFCGAPSSFYIPYLGDPPTEATALRVARLIDTTHRRVLFHSLRRARLVDIEGNLFIDCDYESLEPKVFAHVANDEGLKDIFRKNYDFYSEIAIRTEGITQYSADKKAPNYLKKVAPALRNKAKGDKQDFIFPDLFKVAILLAFVFQK
jgi:hypothetical protein